MNGIECLLHLVKVEQEMTEGLYDFTKNGKCSQCGACCTNFLPVSDVEIERIKKFLRFHKVEEQRKFLPVVGRVVDATCPFRSEKEKKCLIYNCRPGICRDFQCDKPRKKIAANRDEYCGKYKIVNMREEFFSE